MSCSHYKFFRNRCSRCGRRAIDIIRELQSEVKTLKSEKSQSKYSEDELFVLEKMLEDYKVRLGDK